MKSVTMNINSVTVDDNPTGINQYTYTGSQGKSDQHGRWVAKGTNTSKVNVERAKSQVAKAKAVQLPENEKGVQHGAPEGTEFIKSPFEADTRAATSASRALNRLVNNGEAPSWHNASSRDVPLEGLKGGQSVLSRNAMIKILEGGRGETKGLGGNKDMPLVVHYKGENYLIDGHHRAAAAHFLGGKAVHAKYVDVDSAKKG